MRGRKRAELRRKIRDAAIEDVFEDYRESFDRAGLTIEDVRGPQFMARAMMAAQGPFEMVGMFQDFTSATYARMAQATVLDEMKVSLALEGIRGLLLSAIEARSEEIGFLPAVMMESRITRAKFAYATLLPLFSKLGASSSRKLMESFVDTCGADGMEDNAFAQIVDGDPYIVVCPGKVHAAATVAADSGDPRRFTWSLLRTLAHELAHHVDWDEYPQVYDEFQACIAGNHASRLGVDPGRMSTLLNLVVEHGGRPGKIARDLLATDHKMREMSADYWAAEVIAAHLGSAEGRRLSGDERLQLLSDSVSSTCLSGEGGHHPVGAFRIDVLLRQNPSLSREMGCASTKLYGSPGCDLAGEE